MMVTEELIYIPTIGMVLFKEYDEGEEYFSCEIDTIFTEYDVKPAHRKNFYDEMQKLVDTSGCSCGIGGAFISTFAFKRPLYDDIKEMLLQLVYDPNNYVFCSPDCLKKKTEGTDEKMKWLFLTEKEAKMDSDLVDLQIVLAL